MGTCSTDWMLHVLQWAIGKFYHTLEVAYTKCTLHKKLPISYDSIMLNHPMYSIMLKIMLA